MTAFDEDLGHFATDTKSAEIRRKINEHKLDRLNAQVTPGLEAKVEWEERQEIRTVLTTPDDIGHLAPPTKANKRLSGDPQSGNGNSIQQKHTKKTPARKKPSLPRKRPSSYMEAMAATTSLVVQLSNLDADLSAGRLSQVEHASMRSAALASFAGVGTGL